MGVGHCLGIAIATGTAGIIVGTVSLTGAHQVIGEFIELISSGSLILMLIFVALVALQGLALVLRSILVLRGRAEWGAKPEDGQIGA